MTRNVETQIRLTTTTRIWGIATGMLALCIPLSAITKSGSILSLAVIAGAVVSTVAIWKSADDSNNQLVNSIQALEQRVADLETICSTQDVDLHKQINHLGLED